MERVVGGEVAMDSRNGSMALRFLMVAVDGNEVECRLGGDGMGSGLNN